MNYDAGLYASWEQHLDEMEEAWGFLDDLDEPSEEEYDIFFDADGLIAVSLAR